jgi:putative ABC transport system permease protein
MVLPVILVTAGAIVGTALGYMIPLMDESSGLYSFPDLVSIIKPYAIIYGLYALIITVLVNLFVLNRKLSSAPLKLLRKEKKQAGFQMLMLGNMSFINSIVSASF